MAHIPQMIGTIDNYEEAQRIKKIMSSSLPKVGFIYVNVGDAESAHRMWLSNLETAIQHSSMIEGKKEGLEAIREINRSTPQYQKLYDWLDSDALKAALKNEKTPHLQTIVDEIKYLDFGGYSSKDATAYLDQKHGVLEASIAVNEARKALADDPGNAQKQQAHKEARQHAAMAMGRARPSLQPITLRSIKLDAKADHGKVFDDFIKLGVRGWTHAHHYTGPDKQGIYEHCAVIPCTFPRRPKLPSTEDVQTDAEKAHEQVGELLVKQLVEPDLVRARYGDDFLAKAQGYEHKRLEHLGVKWRDYQKRIPKQEYERDSEGSGLFLAYLIANKHVTPKEIEEGYGKAFVEEAFRPENARLLKERLNLDWPDYHAGRASLSKSNSSQVEGP